MNTNITRASIITIGDEILYGQITDTNSQWISEVLDGLGVRVVEKTSIGDSRRVIIETLDRLLAKADLVIVTGGLGPTKDDITKTTLAEFFNTPLTIHQPTLDRLTSFFKKRGHSLNALNQQQAILPKGCIVLPNQKGTAMGMWFDHQGKAVISLPGVPHEMKHLMEEEVVPRVKAHFNTITIYHKVIRTAGIPESVLAEKIAPWENALPPHIKLAYLPNYGQVRLRLTAQGVSLKDLQLDVSHMIDDLVPYAGKYIFGYDNTTLEEAIGQLLIQKGLTLSTAESCTGGYVSHLLTSISGSSTYFLGGVVSYSNEAKISELGVKKSTLTIYGAVSEQTVMEMAAGVRKQLNTSIGISISGVAGPGGGSPEKPVGTVWIGYSDEKTTVAKKLQLTDDRMINIKLSATAVLNFARIQMNQS